MNLVLPKKATKKGVAILAAALAVILLAAWTLAFFNKAEPVGADVDRTPYKVIRGDITASITGSGTVEPIEQYEIQSIVTGDILEDYVTLGATVNKDDLLYVIDSSSAENNLERSQTSYEQQELSHQEKLKNYNKTKANRTIYAPTNGIIKELYVKNGDSVNAGTKLCEIVDSQNLTVRIPFLVANAKNIYVNQSATVYIDDRNEQISGYVSHVATGTYATSGGAVVSDVEITIKNPGALLPGETVTAMVGEYACNDFGTIENSTAETVVAKASGEVKNLSLAAGDSVKSGSVIMILEDENSDSEMRSSELSLRNARLSLDDLIKKLDDYSIHSPISGTVISKTLKGGDTLDGNKTSLAIVADMSKLTFEVNVDELDIKNISVGQSVKVTADALPDKTFDGVIDTISIIGTSVSGVTVYPVTIVISEYEGLLPGMNVDAEIITSEASDVLMVPINAVSRGNLVLIKDDGTDVDNAKRDKERTNKEDAQKTPPTDAPGTSDDENKGPRLPDAPDGFKWASVELGISNDDFIEVTSGLSEGDEIFITVIKNASTQDGGMFGAMSSMRPMNGGGMPSFGGGTPSGAGMPSGSGRASSRGMPGGGMQ